MRDLHAEIAESTNIYFCKEKGIMNNITKLSVIFLVLIVSALSNADVKLPAVISNNMILQQKTHVNKY